MRCTLELVFLDAETLLETVYSATCVYQLLSAGEKRMTFRAYIQTNILLGRSCLKFSATSTLYNYLFVLRMNTLFHTVTPFKSR